MGKYEWEVREEEEGYSVSKMVYMSMPIYVATLDNKDDAESLAKELNHMETQIELSNKIFGTKIKVEFREAS